ncbi:MAG: PHP domain-containing protein [Oscillospiraceae bacterium]
MRRYKYDLHVHSCLSPCGDDEMTPNNLVNMGALLGCEILAITDHNSCKNAPAALEAGERAGILVIPGMELCTKEEAHVVCLFETLAGAMAFDRYVSERIPPILNREKIFGRQLILNGEDECVGQETRLLITASSIGAGEVVALVKDLGGAAFPAHVDKSSYSLVAALGVLPKEAGFTAVEITAGCDIPAFLKRQPEISGLPVIRDSDAHYLENMQESLGEIALPERSAKGVIHTINGVGEGRFIPFMGKG